MSILLRPALTDLSLYVVANRPSFSCENLFYSQCMRAVRGGASCVQLRDYANDFATTLRTAFYMKTLLEGTGVPLFINTPRLIEIARAVKADGVYLEEKWPLSEVRKQLGPKAIIGIPVKTKNDVIAAQQSKEIDYISIKISASQQTCPDNSILWGVHGLREVLWMLPDTLPAVAIGGLHLGCVESIYRELRAGDGIAMAGGLMRKDDPCLAAQKIQAIYHKVRGGV